MGWRLGQSPNLILFSFLPTRFLSNVLSPPLSWEMGRTLRSGSLSCPPSYHGPQSPCLGKSGDSLLCWC